MNLNCWLMDTWRLRVLTRIRALNPDACSVANELLGHQITRRVRSAIPIPLPLHARGGEDNELLRINPTSGRMPYSQRLLVVEVQDKAITVGLGANDHVNVVVGLAKPDSPKAQCAAVNVREKLLDVRCDL